MKPAKHQSMAYADTKAVLMTGTASASFDRGIGVCYNRDYGNATDTEGERDVRVEVPSTTNNRAFAGVLAEDVKLNVNGQAWTRIYEPGSVCEIAIGVDTVVNTGLITCLAGGGNNSSRFVSQGFGGRGSAVPLETVTAVLESVLDGSGALSATDGITLTVSDSSDYTAKSTKVLMLAGENDGTGVFVPGLYGISSITNGTTIVLDSTVLSTLSTGSISCSFVIIDAANDRCLAYLEDGEESGLTQWITPPNTGAAGLSYMAGGITYINGGVTVGTADSDVTFADGTLYGEKKGFICKGALTTNNVCIDLATNGITLAGGALAEINAIDTANDAAFLQWTGLWRTIMVIGNATESGS